MKLAVAFDNNIFMSQAKKLAAKLHLPLVDIDLADSEIEGLDYLLLFQTQGLGLKALGKTSQGSVRVDFLSARLQHRRRSGHNEILGRACGVKASFMPSIIDATAGLGVDSFVLADLGCNVTLVERSPVIFAMLEDGLMRASLAEQRHVSARMSLQSGGSIDYLAALEAGVVDVIYLDPMFPGRGKSAKAKKEMQAFQHLVEEDDIVSEEALLEESRRVAKYRVVVKRPLKAPCLTYLKPNFDLRGKTIRYDVYTKQKLPE